MAKSKFILLILWSFIISYNALAQSQTEVKKETWADKGTVYGTIYANFHTDLGGEEAERGFEVKRAYLGYKSKIDEHFSADLTLDIGSPDDVSEYSLNKRFAYFKKAYVQYQYQNLKVQFGVADTRQLKTQQDFWGYRYLYKSFMDEHKFSSSADLGLVVDYKFSEVLSADFSFLNGEGYHQIQTDEDFKTGLGVTFKPAPWLLVRGYYDTFIANNTNQSNLAGFAGLSFESFTFGAEYNHQWNYLSLSDRHRYGYSFYLTYLASEKVKLFARYDQLYSNTLAGAINPWDLENDGSAIITGLEFSPAKKVNLSLNYQDWLAYAENGTDEHFIYFNLQFKF
ncbi:MAG: porin [Salinivirgaceae bacterium]